MKNPLTPREEDVQRVIVDGLRLLGFTVLITTHRVKKCACGRWSRGDYGATKGVPDLLVRKKGWPPGAYRGLEVKGSRTALSPAQKELLEENGLIIVRSLEDACAALNTLPPVLNPPPSAG